MENFPYRLVDCGTGSVIEYFDDLRKAKDEQIKKYSQHISTVAQENLGGKWIDRIDPMFPLYLDDWKNPWWENRKKDI